MENADTQQDLHVTQERTDLTETSLHVAVRPRLRTCGKFRRRQGEPRIRWNPMKWLISDLFGGPTRMAVSNGSADSWPGVVKATFLREVGLMFP